KINVGPLFPRQSYPETVLREAEYRFFLSWNILAPAGAGRPPRRRALQKPNRTRSECPAKLQTREPSMRSHAFAPAFLFALFAAVGVQAESQPQAADTDAAAGAYCTSKGGKVLARAPFLNTNGPEKTWMRLSGTARFCAFTAKNGSRLELLLSTLVSTQP